MRIMLIIIIIVSAAGPWISPYDPLGIDIENRCAPPSAGHIFGTDNQGRDVFSRVICGTRISVGIGVLAVLASLLGGILIGVPAGFFGGHIDRIISMIIDIALSFPSLLLAIGIAVVLPPGWLSVVLALTFAGWAGFARFVRGIVWDLRSSPYVESARALGAGRIRIMARHILPNCMSLIAVTAFLKLGTFILGEAGLSFLGLGMPPPAPTWGSMINYGREYISTAPWIVIFPGIALAVTVTVCNSAGDRFRDRMSVIQSLSG